MRSVYRSHVTIFGQSRASTQITWPAELYLFNYQLVGIMGTVGISCIFLVSPGKSRDIPGEDEPKSQCFTGSRLEATWYIQNSYYCVLAGKVAPLFPVGILPKGGTMLLYYQRKGLQVKLDHIYQKTLWYYRRAKIYKSDSGKCFKIPIMNKLSHAS